MLRFHRHQRPHSSQDTKAPADKPSFKSWMEKGDPRRDALVQAKAKELGMSEDDVRRAMETQRVMDFATPLTQKGHDQQAGFWNGIKRGVGMSGHDQDSTRTLPDGSLAVNPALTDDKAKFEKAIQDSNASPEAKAAALKSWPAQHDAWLTRATETLKASKTLPGVEDYNEWLTKNTLAGHFSEKLQDGSVRQYTDNEKTQLYLDAMQNRSGVRKFMDMVSTSLVAGGGMVVSGLLGAEALAKNSFQNLTGVDVGGVAASEAAAAMAQQNLALTQSNELTGNVNGAGDRFLSNLIQAVPSIGATIGTGGTAGLILGAAQSAGSTYTDILQHHIIAGDSIEEAHKKAAGTAIASGALSLALGKIMPGGAQALNNPATKNAFATAVRSALHGLREEAIQEAIDGGFNHIASEMAKGKTFNEAATSYAEQFPQNVLTSALLGGGVQAMADKKNGSAPTPQQPATAPRQGAPQQPALADQPAPSQQATPAQQPASPPQPTPPKPPASAQQTSPVQQPTPANPQQQIPHTTTPNNPAPPSGQPTPSASAQQPQTTATDGPPSPPPPSGQPAQTSATPSGQQSPTTVNNGHPPQTPPSPSGSGQQPQTTANDRQPPQTPSALPPPTTAPKSPEQSQRLINHIMNRPPEQRGHPQVQSDVAQARDVLQDHVQRLENQKEPLSDAQKKDLTDAKTTLSRLKPQKPTSAPGIETPLADTRQPHSPESPPAEGTNSTKRPPGDASPSAADTNHAPLTAPEAPHSRGESSKMPHPANPSPDSTHPSNKPSSPESRQQSSAKPSTSPLSVSQSQKLIDNVSKLPAEAQQHPTTRADTDQAKQVVADYVQKLESQPAPLSEGQKKELADAKASLAQAESAGPASPTQATRFKNAPPSSQPGPGSSSPTSGPPQVPASGAPLPSQQLQDHVRAAISGNNARFPGLAAHIAESAGPSGYGAGMWLNENGSIGYHVPTLAKQHAGMDAQTASQHIGALIAAHVQASSGQVTQAQKSKSPASGQQRHGIPGQTAPHALSTIKTALDAHTPRWKSLAKNLESMEAEMKAAGKQGDAANEQMLEQKRAHLKEEMAKLAENTRQLVMVPEAARGNVMLTHVTPTTVVKARAGAELAQMYTHASLLPTVGVVDFHRKRAAYLHGMVLINGQTSPSQVMHEIAHGIEEQNPRVLAACQAFLKKRAGNETPQLLATLTGNSEHGTDMAYKDRFEELGGDHYMGRIYPKGDGTEILTMGIERLHRNPVEFYVNDPEYFEFVIRTLQQP